MSSILTGLGFLFLFVAITGTVMPTMFKNKETGEVPKRKEFLVGGIFAAVIAFVIAALLAPDHEEQAASGQSESSSMTADEQKAQPLLAIEHREKKPDPLDLSAARALANQTLEIINETEQALIDGLQLGDAEGIRKHVVDRIDNTLIRWPKLMERADDDQSRHFSDCFSAASQLNTLAYDALRQKTVESVKYIRENEKEYQKLKKQCSQQISKNDKTIETDAAKARAEEKESDCLTVYGVDKATGKVVAQEKPGHCK